MKWLKRNIVPSALLAVSIVLSLFLFQECEHTSQLEQDLEATNNFLEIEKQQSISRDSIHAQDIVEMKQNLMSEVSARMLLEEEFERFKEISSHVRTETVTRIDTMFIAYNPSDTNDIINDYTDCIPIDTVRAYFIQTPKGINYADTWFAFSGTVDSIGLTIDSMSMVNKFDVTIGWKKPDKPFKFLRRKEPVVELISYSPYTQVNYINNIVVDKKESIFNSKLAWAVYGTTAGIIIGTQIKK